MGGPYKKSAKSMQQPKVMAQMEPIKPEYKFESANEKSKNQKRKSFRTLLTKSLNEM